MRRETDPQDRRAYRIYLTEKSRQLGPVIQQMSAIINDIVFDGFTGEEKALFIEMIRRAIGNISRENDIRKAGK